MQRLSGGTDLRGTAHVDAVARLRMHEPLVADKVDLEPDLGPGGIVPVDMDGSDLALRAQESRSHQ